MNARTLIKIPACLLLALALVFVALGLQPRFVSRAETTPPSVTYIVDRTDDATVTACTTDPDDCTLRGAIVNANTTTNAAIQFSVSLVDLDNPLPAITGGGTMIDGTSVRPHIDGFHIIISSGTFTIQGSNITLSNLVIVNDIAANIYVFSGQNVNISHNYLGVVDGATACNSGGVTYFSSYGIKVGSSAGGSVGNGVYIYDNLIGCHPHDGIGVFGADYVYIGEDSSGSGYGNWIGLSQVQPNSDLGNHENGIGLYSQTGDPTEYAYVRNNTISGNTLSGIKISASHYNTVQGNYIGTNYIGSVAIPNDQQGILLDDGAHDNLIGGAGSLGNIISGNGRNGIQFWGATSNLARCNWIGLNSVGTGYLPNGNAGVAVENGSDLNWIGYNAGDPVCQRIAGNSREGIYVADSDQVAIWTDTSIYNNSMQGVAVVGDSVRVAIEPYAVYGNGLLAIDLGQDGFTSNGSQSPPGPNDWIEYPYIDYGDNTSIIGGYSGAVCNSCWVFIYKSIGDTTTGGGGGIQYLGYVQALTDGSWSKDLSVWGSDLKGHDVTVLTVDPFGNTSEMYPRHGPRVCLPLITR